MTNTIYSSIIPELKERALWIALDRADAMNALTPELVSEMKNCIRSLASDKGVKALVIDSTSKDFCAGADLKFLSEVALSDLRKLSEFMEEFGELLALLEELPVPVICVVRGHALAGGLELALACDFIVASQDATFGDQHINFGLIPGGGGSQRLPRRIGAARAKALLLTGGRLSGIEAVDCGLAYRAVPADEVDGEVEALVSTLVKKSGESMKHLKRLVHLGAAMPLKQALALEMATFVEYVATSDDAREGVTAFIEKRRPVF